MAANPVNIAFVLIVAAGLVIFLFAWVWRGISIQRENPETEQKRIHVSDRFIQALALFKGWTQKRFSLSKPRFKDSQQQAQISSVRTAAGMTKVHFRLELSEGESVCVIVEGLPPVDSQAVIPGSENRGISPVVVTLQGTTDASAKVASFPDTGGAFGDALPALETKVTNTEMIPVLQKEETSRAERLVLLLAAVSLAIIPPILVLLDRWRGVNLNKESVGKIWNSMDFLSQLTYPPYFIYVFLCLVGIFLLVWRGDGTRLNFVNPDPEKEQIFTPFQPGGRQRNLGKQLIWGGGITLLGSFLIQIRVQEVYGWLFLLGMVLFFFGWTVRELSFNPILEVIQLYWKPGLAFLITHIALLLALSSYYSDQQFLWLWVILLVISIVYTLYKYHARIPIILWVMTLALVLYTIRINGWEFSVVGDEYSFFMYAQELAKDHNLSFSINKLFNGIAVFGSHPFFSSFLQMISVRLFSGSNFGWRFSNLYLCSLSLGFFYLFFRSFVRSGTAVIAVVFLAASHYIMTFGKIGYNNLQSYFILSIVLASSTWAVRRRQTLAYMFLGISLGVCFYVYPAALYSLPIVLLMLIFYDPPSSRNALKSWGTSFISMVVLTLPLLLQNPYWKAKIPGTIFWTPEIIASASSLLDHFAKNLIYAFLSFLYIPQEGHFIVSSYVDPLSGALLLLGLGYMVISGRKARFIAFFLTGYFAMLFFVGASHGGKYPPNTRMFLLLPWFALLSAAGFEWLKERAKGLGMGKVWMAGMLAIILVAVFGLNIYQAYSLSKQRSTGLQSPAMLFVKVLERIQKHGVDDAGPLTIWFLTKPPWGIEGYQLFLKTYDIPREKLRLEKVDLETSYLTEETVEMLQKPEALAIIYPDLEPDLKDALSEVLEGLDKLPCPVKTENGFTRFNLWYSEPVEWICADGG